MLEAVIWRPFPDSL